MNRQEIKINNTEFIVVDTPGYNDSQHGDKFHFNNLEAYLSGSGGIDAFLLVMNGTNYRFDANFKQMLQDYGEYFGCEFWEHLIIIITRIEGREKRKFVQKQKAERLRQNIKNTMKKVAKNCELMIITIGFDDDYQTFCEDVANEVIRISRENEKLDCRNIQSPIKVLKSKQKELQKTKCDITDKIKSRKEKIVGLDGEITELNNKLNNPEWLPIFTNPNADI